MVSLVNSFWGLGLVHGLCSDDVGLLLVGFCYGFIG